jgi:hypothetical protein
MVVLSVFVLFSLPAGFAVGWLSKCPTGWLVVRCAVTSLLLLVAINVVNNGVPHPFVLSYLLSAAVYLAIPYAVFFLAPCVIGGLIAAGVKKRFARSKG